MCRKATAASFVPKRYTGYSRHCIWASAEADLAYAKSKLTEVRGLYSEFCIPDLQSNRHPGASWSNQIWKRAPTKDLELRHANPSR